MEGMRIGRALLVVVAAIKLPKSLVSNEMSFLFGSVTRMEGISGASRAPEWQLSKENLSLAESAVCIIIRLIAAAMSSKSSVSVCGLVEGFVGSIVCMERLLVAGAKGSRPARSMRSFVPVSAMEWTGNVEACSMESLANAGESWPFRIFGNNATSVPMRVYILILVKYPDQGQRSSRHSIALVVALDRETFMTSVCVHTCPPCAQAKSPCQPKTWPSS